MKKLVTILVILGLAGMANADWIDTFESYTGGETIAGSNGWLAGGNGGGGLETVGNTATAGVGISSSVGYAGDGGQPWYTEHKDVGGLTTGTVTLNVLALTPTNGRNTIAMMADDYGDPRDDILVYVYYNGGYSLRDVQNGSFGYYNGTGVISGWHEVELSLNLDTDLVTARYRLTDNDGNPTGGWLPIGDGSFTAQDLPLDHWSIGVEYGAVLDGLPEPMTLSVLALGGLAALLRRRR